MNERCLLSIVTVTKDDLNGCAITINSAKSLRLLPGVEQVVVAAYEPVPHCDDKSVVILSQRSTGIAGAFNEGVAAAHGEWIWFLNGGDSVDSRISPEFLFELLRRSLADVIIGATTYEGEPTQRPHPLPMNQWPPVQPWIPHPSSLVRRRLFAQLGNFDERYSIVMDYEWWLRALSSQVAVDVLSVPFAVFARGGLSQRPESRGLIVQERDDAIRRHQRGLWRATFSTVQRVGRMWLAACFSRRIKRIDQRQRSI